MEPVAYVRRRRPQVDPLGTCRQRFVRAPFDDSWRRHPDGRGSRVHISPLADRARALRDESVSMATENRTFVATKNCTLLGRTSRAERTFSR